MSEEERTAWKRLSEGTMPEPDRDREFLLCRGYPDPEDRIVCLARCVPGWYGEACIRYAKPYDGWVYLPPEEWPECRWAEIPALPDGPED